MASRARSRLIAMIDAFARDVRGNAAVVMVAGIAVFMGLAGTGFDFAMFHAQRQALQRGADAGALAAARELALLTANRNGVKQTAKAFALQEIGAAVPMDSIDVRTRILDNGKGVEVTVTGVSKPLMTFFALDSFTRIQARAEASLVGGTPLCALALAPALPNAISMTMDAKILAEECAVYSNSRSPLGIVALNNAELTSALTCTAGGFGGLAANFDPEPTTDCPRIEDPLSGRAEPPVGPCDHIAKIVLIGATTTLSPGVYCGGLTIGVGAKVKLNPGVYVMKNGPLLVAANATMTGQNVGFFFKGVLAHLVFEATSHVDLTAPKAGPMAGFLFFGDRASPARLFVIHSNDARNLLGTIYLPHGVLLVDASRPVADRSAYTVIVAERIVVQDGPTLVLNADYDGTDVPVPKGVGPRPATPALTH